MQAAMKHRILAAALFAAIPAAAFGQASPPVMPGQVAGAPVATADRVQVAIDTSMGRIVIALDRLHAPITTANFLRYVDNHRFDGETFYRSMHTGGGGLIQAGVRSDSRKVYPPIAHEPTSKTGLSNVTGAVSMARLDPGSATSDFFIMLSDMKGLDAGAPGGDADGFAVFGQVVEGMDVVKKIFDSPTDPEKGEGVMKGQFLEPPIKIIKASRLK